MSIDWNKPFEVRDMRNGEWYWVQKEVLASKKINASDKLVYSALAYYSNQKSQRCFPSHRTIAKLINIGERTVYTAMRRLIENKFIAVVKKSGKVNHYELLKIATAKFAGVDGNGGKPLPNSMDTTAKQQVVPLPNSHTNNNNITIINNKRIEMIKEQIRKQIKTL